jgi:imidazolonepropionase-like amidohydrolase
VTSSRPDLPVLHLTGPVLLGPDQVVGQAWVVGGRISLTAPAGTAARQLTRVGGWVLPGLVDAHCHVGLDAHGAVDRDTQVTQASTDRDAGTLLIRDAGSPADTRWLDGRDDLPRMVRAGRHLARTRRYLRGIGHELEPDQLPQYVAREAAAGDGWVKLVGDWIDRDLGDLAPCWPADALRAAIETAHAAGARVTAHCFGEDCLPDLIAAGIDCIEHACGLDDGTRAAAAAAGVAIVPTLVNIGTFPQLAASGEQRFPLWAAHLRALHERRYDTVRAAWQAGIPVFAGTDAGGSLGHGLIAAEVAELVTAGLPGVAALDAACWAARDWLGRAGLGEGAPADLVVLAADPRQDVRTLADPRLVVLRGVGYPG